MPKSNGVLEAGTDVQPASRGDLDEIFDFIAADNPLRARSFVEEIRDACRIFCETPLIGTERPDLMPDIRIHTFRRRVLIAYRVLPDRIQVLRVFTAGRDYERAIEPD